MKIDWNRRETRIMWHGIEKDIQRELSGSTSLKSLFEVRETMIRLAEKCGPHTHTRGAMRRLSAIILKYEQPVIFTPCCLNYGNSDNDSDLGGMPELAKKHVNFLRGIHSLLPSTRIIFAIADHDADDAELCERVGKTSEEFRQLMRVTLTKIREVVGELGWEACSMQELIPNLRENEQLAEESIRSTPRFRDRLGREARMREPLYSRMSRLLTEDEKLAHTVKTASQYVALGRYANEQNWIVCNHSTVNLGWYTKLGVALLHNPVSFL